MKNERAKSVILFIAVLVILPILIGAVFIEYDIGYMRPEQKSLQLPQPKQQSILQPVTTVSSGLMSPNELAGKEEYVLIKEYWVMNDNTILCGLELSSEGKFTFEIRDISNGDYDTAYGYYWFGDWYQERFGTFYMEPIVTRVIEDGFTLLPDEELDYLREVKFTVTILTDMIKVNGEYDDSLTENPVVNDSVDIFKKIMYNETVPAGHGIAVNMVRIDEYGNLINKKSELLF